MQLLRMDGCQNNCFQVMRQIRNYTSEELRSIAIQLDAEGHLYSIIESLDHLDGSRVIGNILEIQYAQLSRAMSGHGNGMMEQAGSQSGYLKSI
jgi:hypothetical protein